MHGRASAIARVLRPMPVAGGRPRAATAHDFRATADAREARRVRA